MPTLGRVLQGQISDTPIANRHIRLQEDWHRHRAQVYCDRHRTSCSLRAITLRPHTVYSAELLRRDLERRAARAIIYYVDRYGEVHVRHHSDSKI